MNPGDWAWNAEYETICRIIDVQTAWGHRLYWVWLPTQDAVVCVPTDRLEPLDAHSSVFNPKHLLYIVTAARIAEIATTVEDQPLVDISAVGVDAGFLRAYRMSGPIGPDITNREVAQ
jgi:hypothetical protein